MKYLSYKTSYLNEEVNCTEPSPQLVFPGHSYGIKAGGGRRGGSESENRGVESCPWYPEREDAKSKNSFFSSSKVPV
jgi:hypothetical protein